MFNNRCYINDKWLYYDKWQDGITEGIALDGTEVRLPHSVCMLPFHYYDEKEVYKVCGYRRTFRAPVEWKRKRLLLTFEGAAHRCEVFINSSFAGESSCGYNSFTMDITELVNIGAANSITVKLDTRLDLPQPPFYKGLEAVTFGGLHGDVYIEARDPVYMSDIFLNPTLQEIPKTRGMSLKRLQEVTVAGRITTVVSLSDRGRARAEEHRLFICQFLNGKQISNQPLAPNGSTTTLAGKVHIWDTASPRLYELKTELRLDGETVDTDISTIGFRMLSWKPSGFYLNGRRLVLRGLNRRQTWPYVGLAMPKSIQAEDARILKQELGCNAVRCCDGSPSSHFIDACDKYGLLVFCDVYGRAFDNEDDWRGAAMEAAIGMVRAHRSHPSVMLWGIGYQGVSDADWKKELHQAVKTLDPSRYTAATTSLRMEEILEEVYAYEDYSGTQEEAFVQPKAAVTSDRKKAYIISSYGGYQSPAKPGSSPPVMTAQMLCHASILNSIASEDSISGGFGADMCDHNARRITASDDGIRSYGVMDAFRNPKYAAWVYAAASGRGNVLFVSSHMNRRQNPGRVYGNVYIVTNADRVAMYCDGIRIKDYASSEAVFSSMRHGPIEIDNYTIEEDGRLDMDRREDKLLSRYLNERVKGAGANSAVMGITGTILKRIYKLSDEKLDNIYSRYFDAGDTRSFKFEAIQDDRVVSAVIKEPSNSMRLGVRLSKDELVEELTYDVIAVRVGVFDQNDNVLEDYDGYLRCEIKGPAALIGGDTVFRGGRCAFYIKSLNRAGEAMVSLFADGLKPVHISVPVKVSEKEGLEV